MWRHQESLIDVIQAAQRVIKLSQGITRADLENNEEKQSAILYQLMMIEEATKKTNGWNTRYSLASL